MWQSLVKSVGFMVMHTTAIFVQRASRVRFAEIHATLENDLGRNSERPSGDIPTDKLEQYECT